MTVLTESRNHRRRGTGRVERQPAGPAERILRSSTSRLLPSSSRQGTKQIPTCSIVHCNMTLSTDDYSTNYCSSSTASTNPSPSSHSSRTHKLVHTPSRPSPPCPSHSLLAPSHLISWRRLSDPSRYSHSRRWDDGPTSRLARLYCPSNLVDPATIYGSAKGGRGGGTEGLTLHINPSGSDSTVVSNAHLDQRTF